MKIFLAIIGAYLIIGCIQGVLILKYVGRDLLDMYCLFHGISKGVYEGTNEDYHRSNILTSFALVSWPFIWGPALIISEIIDK